MKITVASDQPWEVAADVLVVPIAGEPRFDGQLGEIDRRSGGELRALLAFGELSAKRYSTALAASGELPVGRVLVVGLGDPGKLDRESIRHAAATCIRRLAGRKVDRLAFWLGGIPAAVAPGSGSGSAASAASGSGSGGLAAPGPREIAEQVARGIVEGSFEPGTIYREQVDSPPVELAALILVAPGGDRTTLKRAGERGQIIGLGANRTRRLANRAANDVSPEVLADEARALAKQYGLSIDVIGPDQATKLGMGMFMAVGRGSDNPPRMIVMRSGDAGEKDARGRHLAIVGKGVCFDSGGISIKPSDRMEEMKMDKTGACTVISAIATVAELAPGTPLLALAPAVENMPGPHSARPGDIVRALNGKFVDITNTDAEGRLILGDALTYAERLGATHLVDVATLTGAVGRALGHMVAGGFGEPQGWYDEVAAAGARAGERYWQLPLIDDYRSELDSVYGDIVNSGSVDGSLVKSGLFIREFVTRPWAHLDIASTAYYRKSMPFAARGASGASHATLVELALAGAGKVARKSEPTSGNRVAVRRAARSLSRAGSGAGAGARSGGAARPSRSGSSAKGRHTDGRGPAGPAERAH
jgi:leucyl aminopeptidase